MRIALVGYGKMGKAIEQIAKDKGHSISFVISGSSKEEIHSISPENTDVAIEFTTPTVGYDNIKTLISNKVPTVSGTTGWLDKQEEINQLTADRETAFFYASNFSVGVNIFFNLNKVLAKLMNNFPNYNVDMEEIHHIHKLDAPSGTAITLAEGIFENLERKNNYTADKEDKNDDLAITAKRIDEVPGTHIVNYRSEIDTIEISHTAHNRQGFAGGAVLAAEWLADKQGVFGMEDLLNL